MTNLRDFIVTDEDYEEWLRRRRRVPLDPPPNFGKAIAIALLLSAPVWAVIIWAVYGWLERAR